MESGIQLLFLKIFNPPMQPKRRFALKDTFPMETMVKKTPPQIDPDTPPQLNVYVPAKFLVKCRKKNSGLRPENKGGGSKNRKKGRFLA